MMLFINVSLFSIKNVYANKLIVVKVRNKYKLEQHPELYFLRYFLSNRFIIYTPLEIYPVPFLAPPRLVLVVSVSLFSILSSAQFYAE